MTDKERELTDMLLHDEQTLEICHDAQEINILRVINGWIYKFSEYNPAINEWEIKSTTFVPENIG